MKPMKPLTSNFSRFPGSSDTFSEDAVDNKTRMGWFQAFRGDFGYSHYGEYRTSVTADIPFAAIIYTCVLISIASLIAAAGIRGKERWYTLARMVYSLAVGSVILVSIFGYCWQTGEIGVHSVYIYRRESHMEGTVGVRIGLKTANLTLTGRIANQGSSFSYNEELVLLDVIHSPPQLWHALDRGLPQPLLTVLEHFDTDSGGLRYGRACWLAGYIANILLWSAFAFWVTGNILLCSVVWYGAACFTLTGACMILAPALYDTLCPLTRSAFAFWVTGNILLCSVVWYGAACFTLTGACMILAPALYDTLCPRTELRMPCADGPLNLQYGWCFWSTLVFGILTTLLGLVLFALDQKVPNKVAEFFLLDLAMDDASSSDDTPRLYAPPRPPPPRRPPPRHAPARPITTCCTYPWSIENSAHDRQTHEHRYRQNVNRRTNGHILTHPGDGKIYTAQAQTQTEPDVQILEKRLPLSSSPVNWYDNFACEPTARGNPVFEDSGHDVTSLERATHSVRARAYSDIKEEVEQRDSVIVDDKTNDRETTEEDAEQRAVTAMDRMNQIYVDVEPSYSVTSHSLNSSFRSLSPPMK